MLMGSNLRVQELGLSSFGVCVIGVQGFAWARWALAVFGLHLPH